MVADVAARMKARAGLVAASTVVVIGLAGAVIGRVGWADNPATSQRKIEGRIVSPVDVPADRVSGLAGMEGGFVAIAQRVQPSVVSIHVRRTLPRTQGSSMPDIDQFFGPMFPDQGMPRVFRNRQGDSMPPIRRVEGAGSGFVVRSDGWIATNDHVVNGADKVTVKLQDGREFEGTVRRDYRSDVSLVKIDATGLTPLAFADSDRVSVGQWAIAFGSPFTLDDTMTVGIVSAKGRQRAISEGSEGRFYPSLLQTDAAINPGNSGGPLVDIRGRVMGINVAIDSPSGASAGVAYAISANTAKGIVDQLLDRGKVVRGYMGVVPRALTPSERDRYGVASGGALLEAVTENSPASRAGLQVEDIITKFDGKPVADDVAFRSMVAGAAPGAKSTLVVRRDKRELEVTVTLGSVPEDTASAAPSREPVGGKLGLRVEPVTDSSAEKYNLGDIKSGLVVTEVQSGGAADDAGVQPGDVIIRANGRDVKSEADLRAVTNSAKAGDRVRLVVHRDKTNALLTLTVP